MQRGSVINNKKNKLYNTNSIDMSALEKIANKCTKKDNRVLEIKQLQKEVCYIRSKLGERKISQDTNE